MLIKHWRVLKYNEFKKILRFEAAGGVFMMLFAALALIIANTPLVEYYNILLVQKVTMGIGAFTFSMNLKAFTSDVLMVLFFLNVSMELKKDFEQEILDQKKQILLPALAAVGGMAVPAFIYYYINRNIPENINGWAIPCGTDTAFAVAVLLLIGKGLPRSAKVFLLAAAIFDDLGAIVLIALFYSNELQYVYLAWVLLGCTALFALNYFNVVSKVPYIAISLFLFFMLHEAGIHTTIAGVLLGLAIPLADKKDLNHFPLKELLNDIRPVVSFFILPLFAFVNAGVPVMNLNLSDLYSELTLGVALGLFVGKQVGIFGVAFILIQLRLVKMPKNMNFKFIYGTSILAGIGFTMSIFIGQLSFPNNHAKQEMVVLGILLSSLCASVWGYVYLKYAILSTRKKAELEELMRAADELRLEEYNSIHDMDEH